MGWDKLSVCNCSAVGVRTQTRRSEAGSRKWGGKRLGKVDNCRNSGCGAVGRLPNIVGVQSAVCRASAVAALHAPEQAVANSAGPVIFVSNEVSLGIVPDNALAHRFRDMAGDVDQGVARLAGRMFS